MKEETLLHKNFRLWLTLLAGSFQPYCLVIEAVCIFSEVDCLAIEDFFMPLAVSFVVSAKDKAVQTGFRLQDLLLHV